MNPAHRKLLILALAWLVAALSNWMLALYMLPVIIGAVRMRPGIRWAFCWNLLLGWTGGVWLFVLLWAVEPNTALPRPVQVRTRISWQITPKHGTTHA